MIISVCQPFGINEINNSPYYICNQKKMQPKLNKGKKKQSITESIKRSVNFRMNL